MEKFKSLEDEGVSEDQMAVFLDDLKNPKKPDTFFDEIEDRLEKIELLQLSQELFLVDGDFDDREKRAFRNLKLALSKSLNVDRFVIDDLAKLKGKTIVMADIIDKILKE